MIKLIFTVYFSLVIQMSVVWLIYRILKNPSVVDVSWSFGLMMAGLIYIFHQPMHLRLWLITSLLILWALRLGGYLWFTRIRKGQVDKRYLQLSRDWKIKTSLGFFIHFQMQAIFILILSIVFLFAASTRTAALSWLDVLGIMIVIVGMIGQCIADAELTFFKNKQIGQVCQIGLWRYSRHPNYFFEWLTWWGFTLFALAGPYGWIGLISPLWLFIIFTQMTIPITEQGSVTAKGQAYIDYQRKTAKFIPWFIKNS